MVVSAKSRAQNDFILSTQVAISVSGGSAIYVAIVLVHYV